MLRLDIDHLRPRGACGRRGHEMHGSEAHAGDDGTDLIPVHEDDPGGSADSQYSTRGPRGSPCFE